MAGGRWEKAEPTIDPAVAVRSRKKAWTLGQSAFPKNCCRTTIAERMVETLAELPLIGDQVVCLSHDQAARSLLAALRRVSERQLRVVSA